MKLVIAIVQDEDTPALTDALVASGHRFTKVSTTGSFLRTGNTSLLIGVDDDQVQAVLGILRRTCRRRTQVAVPYSPALSQVCSTCQKTSRSRSVARSCS